jgi:dTDP-L-rhamnose 4-epimerase
MERVLVTGGAGFIGSHLVNALLGRGHRVRVLDALVPQVHGQSPRALPADVEFIKGDVRDPIVVERSLQGADVVFHEAAEVGVGQSMFEIRRYVDTNTLGTATLLEALAQHRGSVRKLIVASSASIYGEGAYRCARCGPVVARPRPLAQLERRQWELACSSCEGLLEPIPTPETKPLDPASVYAVNKQDQEQLSLIVGRAYGIPTVALRYFNTFGVGQSLSNPYTGAIAILASRLLNKRPPKLFEDGLQRRDFTHVSDIVQANLLAMECESARDCAINVGTGRATSIVDVALALARGLGIAVAPSIVDQFREGDVRHCVADISRARALLGYEPRVSLEEGIPPFLEWVRQQEACDSVDRAAEELRARGLMK